MHQPNSLKARQIKAARALLDWSQEDLASASHLSVATIRKLELGSISPRGKTTAVLRQAFEDAGLEFMEPDGVRHRPEDITIYQGPEGAKAFYDEVYNTAKRKHCDIVLVCSNPNRVFTEILGDEYKSFHLARMTAMRNTISVKCIVMEDKNVLPAPDYCEYRWISKHYVDSVPFYVYDDRYAIIVYEADPSPKITVIQSRTVADAFRRQFQSMWDKATPLNAPMKKDANAKRKN